MIREQACQWALTESQTPRSLFEATANEGTRCTTMCEVQD
jgi:hypothetical protein